MRAMLYDKLDGAYNYYNIGLYQKYMTEHLDSDSRICFVIANYH